MLSFLALFALLPSHLVAAQECTFVDDVEFSKAAVFEYNQMDGDPPRTYYTTNRAIHPSDDCSYLVADFGYYARACYACGDPDNRREFMGGLLARASSETSFGRELVIARADLVDIALVDADGNRADVPQFDYTLFDELDCTCDGEAISNDKGTCPSGLVCSTMGATPYGSVAATFHTEILGNVASTHVNVSIVHDKLEGTPVITVGVPPRFKTYEEEDGSFVLKNGEARIVFDSKCGENALSLESVALEPDRDTQRQEVSIPKHNNVTFHMDATNATCDWSYSIEIELEETGAGVRFAAATSSLVAMFVAFFV